MCVLAVPPLHIYIGWRGGDAAKEVPQVGGILLGRLSIRPPPFHIHPEGEGRRREERRKGEAESLPFLLSSPLSFSSSSAHMGGAGAPAGCCVSLIRLIGPNLCRGPICTRSETLPVSGYHRPIYEYLPLDHFKTPRHVCDLIQDSKQHSVTKSHNSYNTKLSSNVKCADPTGSTTM